MKKPNGHKGWTASNAAHVGMVKFIQMLAVSFILVCASGAARPSDYEDGDAASRRGDYATALKLLSPLAQKGHVRAQYNWYDVL